MIVSNKTIQKYLFLFSNIEYPCSEKTIKGREKKRRPMTVFFIMPRRKTIGIMREKITRALLKMVKLIFLLIV
jgi:hypothetical protein